MRSMVVEMAMTRMRRTACRMTCVIGEVRCRIEKESMLYLVRVSVRVRVRVRVRVSVRVRVRVRVRVSGSSPPSRGT